MAVCGVVLAALLLSSSQDYLADALKALDAHQPAAAEPLLRKAVEADPNDFSAHFNLAFALSQLRKDAEAIAEYRRTLQLKPGLYEADLNLGILLLRSKQPADALPVLKEAAAAKPTETRPNLYYAQALLETGEASQAEQRYAAIVAADPQSVPAQSGLARSLLNQSRLAEAADRFRAANDRNGLLEVAGAFEKAGQTADAIAIYQHFLEEPGVREHLGRLQIDGNDVAGAIPNLEDAVRKAPDTANRLALADAYRLSGQAPKMLEQLELAAAADPGNFDLRMSLGRALRDSHKLIPAAEQFAAATRLNPASVSAWHELATALIVSEKYSEGLAALDRIRALGKEIPGDYWFRAITLDKLKRKPEAVAAYQQFLSSDNGAHPDQAFQARQRMRIIESELKK